MAITISYPVAGYDPQSELKVHAALKALSDDWHIIHSVAWLGPRGNRLADGEADFVLLHRSFGIVVLEVKGGGVDLRNGRWVSEDRHGRVNDIKNPFEQATTSKVNLHKWLRGRLGLYVPTCHAVVFPDITYSLELGPAAPTEIVIDGRGLSDVHISPSHAFSTIGNRRRACPRPTRPESSTRSLRPLQSDGRWPMPLTTPTPDSCN